MGTRDDPSKSMVTLSNYLMKKRKWPYRGWHKRFFVLQNGYLIYSKSEQEVILYQKKSQTKNHFFFQDKTWSI
jgi:hypothetical protein